MPFIGLKTAQKLTPSQKVAIKNDFGKAIELIPGKKEEKMMMCIEDGMDLFFRGEEKNSCAFVKVEIKDAAAFEDKAAMTEAICKSLNTVANISTDDIYLNITEYNEWGSRGILKK